VRISSEVRRALKFPADALRVGLKRNHETLQAKKEDTSKVQAEAERAIKYFIGLIREAGEIARGVRSVDLESVHAVATAATT
jgi:mitofusin